MHQQDKDDLDWRYVWNKNRRWPETVEARKAAGTSTGSVVCRGGEVLMKQHAKEWKLKVDTSTGTFSWTPGNWFKY